MKIALIFICTLRLLFLNRAVKIFSKLDNHYSNFCSV